MAPTRDETVIVTGGAGYIGSHAAKLLLESGRSVVAIDDLRRGSERAVGALGAIGGERFRFVRADIADRGAVERALRESGARAAMHFAALAYVRESTRAALVYHANNTAAALRFLQACEACGVERFVFSSTCAVYGEVPAVRVPITEDERTEPINPYGWSKLAYERALADHARAKKLAGERFAFGALRYFNVAGADPDGTLGENHDPETHLIPSAILAALGKREPLTVYGDDFPTEDGTAVRDYIHVTDLARAHVRMLETLDPGGEDRGSTFNLGLGRGVSVREILESVERVVGKPVPVEWAARHPADPARLTADAARARAALGWAPAITDLDMIVRTALAWIETRDA